MAVEEGFGTAALREDLPGVRSENSRSAAIRAASGPAPISNTTAMRGLSVNATDLHLRLVCGGSQEKEAGARRCAPPLNRGGWTGCDVRNGDGYAALLVLAARTGTSSDSVNTEPWPRSL